MENDYSFSSSENVAELFKTMLHNMLVAKNYKVVIHLQFWHCFICKKYFDKENSKE